MEYFFDLHEDLPTYVGINGLMKENSDLKKKADDRHADLPAYKAAGAKIIISSFFPFKKGKNGEVLPQTKEEFAESFRKFALFLLQNPEFEIIRNKVQLEEIEKKPKIGLVFHIEGLPFVEEISDIVWLYDLGFRSFGLSWNYHNQITGDCRQEEGLSSFGKKIAAKIHTLNAVIDLTHSSKKTFWDIKKEVGLSKVFYSHTAVEEKGFFHPQTIDKKILEEIRNYKGIVGMTFLPTMYKKINLHAFNEKIIKLVREGFENNLSLGTDYFGFDFNSSPAGLENIECFIEIYNSLKRELPEKVVSKIFYENAKNFLKRNFN